MFVNACERAVIAPHIQQLAELAHERQESGTYTPEPKEAAKQDYQDRLRALKEVRENFGIDGIPHDPKQPEKIFSDAFGNTDTVRRLNETNPQVTVPEKTMEQSIYRYDKRGKPDRVWSIYHPRSMLFPAPSGSSPGLEIIDRILKTNEFVTGRRYGAHFSVMRESLPGIVGYTEGYADVHGVPVLEEVATWNENMKVFDPGAGQAGFFRSLIEPTGLDKELPLPRSLPKLVAVSVKKPGSVDEDEVLASAASQNKFEYVEGKLGEPGFDLEQTLGHASFDAVVGTFDGAHYWQFHYIAHSYGMLLKEGGRWFFHLELFKTKFNDANGRELSIQDVFDQIQGFALLPSRWAYRRSVAFVAVRTDEPMRVPEFSAEFTADTPPISTYTLPQEFQWVGDSPADPGDDASGK